MNDVTQQPSTTPETETSSTPPTTTTPDPSLVNQQSPTPEAPAFSPIEVSALTLPEGLTFADEDMNNFLAIINNQGISHAERAQALIDLQANLTTKSSEAGSQAWNDQQQAWQNEVQNDPELGGANLQTTLANVGRVMDKFGTPEIRSAFDQTGAGNHPQIVRFLNELGKQFTEATPAAPGSPTNTQSASTADRIFGIKNS